MINETQIGEVTKIDACSAQILVTLKDWGDEWLMYDMLATDTGFDVRTCKAAMRRLRDAGYVEHRPCVSVQDEYTPNGSGFFLTKALDKFKACKEG